MAHKTLIGGTSYEVSGGKTLIGGTAYGIAGGKTLIGGTGYGISFGTAIGSLAVGSSVYMNIDGASYEFLVIHQGLPSSMYDSSCNGTWVLQKMVLPTSKQWNSSNNNSYTESNVHSYANDTFLKKLDSSVQSIIKQVKIPYVNGTGYSPVASGTKGLSTKIFSLSGYEVGWTTSNDGSLPQDGACLSYFSGMSATDSRRIAYMTTNSAVARSWWLRSPYYNKRSIFTVTTDGGLQYVESTSVMMIRPAFILPSETLVDGSGNVLA